MYVDGMVVNEFNRNIVFACECVCVRLCFVCGACIQEHSSMCGWCLLVKTTVDNNVTLTFRFYETTIERKNGFRCTDRRTVEKWNDKYCAMILERFGWCVEG